MPKNTEVEGAPVRHEVEVDTRIAAGYAKYLAARRTQDQALQSLYYLIPRSLRASRYENNGYILLDGVTAHVGIRELEELSPPVPSAPLLAPTHGKVRRSLSLTTTRRPKLPLVLTGDPRAR